MENKEKVKKKKIPVTKWSDADNWYLHRFIKMRKMTDKYADILVEKYGLDKVKLDGTRTFRQLLSDKSFDYNKFEDLIKKHLLKNKQ